MSYNWPSTSSKILSSLLWSTIFQDIIYYRSNKILISGVSNIVIMCFITRLFFIRSQKIFWATKNTLASRVFPELLIIEKFSLWVTKMIYLFLLWHIFLKYNAILRYHKFQCILGHYIIDKSAMNLQVRWKQELFSSNILNQDARLFSFQYNFK